MGLHQRPDAGQPAFALLPSYGGVLPVFPGCRLHLRHFGWPSRTASRPFCAVSGATWVASLRITSNLHGYGSYPPRAEPGHDPGISSCTLATYPLVHQPYHFGGVTKMIWRTSRPPSSGKGRESPTACPPSRRGEQPALRAHSKGGIPTAVIRHPLWDVTIFSHFFGCLR